MQCRMNEHSQSAFSTVHSINHTTNTTSTYGYILPQRISSEYLNNRQIFIIFLWILLKHKAFCHPIYSLSDRRSPLIFKYFLLPCVFMRARTRLFVLLPIAIYDYFVCKISEISFFSWNKTAGQRSFASLFGGISLFFIFCLSCLEKEILEATEVMEVQADEFDNRSSIFLSKTFDNIGMMLSILWQQHIPIAVLVKLCICTGQTVHRKTKLL